MSMTSQSSKWSYARNTEKEDHVKWMILCLESWYRRAFITKPISKLSRYWVHLQNYVMYTWWEIWIYINIYFGFSFIPLKSPLYEIYQHKLNYEDCENFQHNWIRQQKMQIRGSNIAEMFQEATLFFLGQGYTWTSYLENYEIGFGADLINDHVHLSLYTQTISVKRYSHTNYIITNI